MLKDYVNTTYNRPRKNEVRVKVIKYFRPRMNRSAKLHTLETKDFLFAKQFKGQKLNCYQINKNEYVSMKKVKPKNVTISYGNVNTEIFKGNYKLKGVYLDYCNSWKTNRETISKLFEKDKLCDKCPVAFTFALRSGRTKQKISLRKQIQYSLYYYANMNEYIIQDFKYVSYRDTMPMATIMFTVRKTNDR